jgi:pyruvate dehydrogenase E2 component (dihydrolipoamide acetyltransferase)
MSRSKREIPHYYLESPIDLTRSLGWLNARNAERPVLERLLPAAVLIKAVARALRDVPELNGYWIDDQLQKQEAVHIGFAISLREGGGLIAPAIHDVHLRNLDELMVAIHDLIPRARAGRLRSSELSDATITVTNLGDLGVKTVFGVIYPPQVALVAFGKISDEAWVESGIVKVRPVLTATLSADHRATDGRRGAQFLEALNDHLQTPERL